MKSPLQKFDGVLCKRCAGVDEMECLMVDVRRVESFVYLRNELIVGG